MGERQLFRHKIIGLRITKLCSGIHQQLEQVEAFATLLMSPLCMGNSFPAIYIYYYTHSMRINRCVSLLLLYAGSALGDTNNSSSIRSTHECH